ncbi:MAG: hypothetical protein M1837_006179 [Sclerophora amabilis]|nr:MAG: hypothetical protein M1837_006179 [Sclerophora amabilis]
MVAYGNYKNYQGSKLRHIGSSPAAAHQVDPRLALVDHLVPDIFRGKDAIDIGCNNGAIVVQLALSFHSASARGIDVDQSLIDQAQSHLSFCYSRLKPDSNSNRDAIQYFPVSSVLDHGHRPCSPVDHAQDEGDGRQALPATFPHNVHFICEDWVNSRSPLQAAAFDIILAFSVIKWIHLQNLDAGLGIFFRKCASSLRTGGYLVLEIQPWSSYERAVRPKKFPQLASSLAQLKTRPEHFPAILKKQNFVEIARSDDLPRTIHIYQKT